MIPWKPGQSGNPKGRPQGSRNKLSEQFVADLHAAWQLFGRPALMTTALTEPSVFVRVVASLMPRDIEVTISAAKAERLSDDDLAGYLEEADSGDFSQAA